MPGGVAAEKKQLRISFPDFFSGGGGVFDAMLKKIKMYMYLYI